MTISYSGNFAQILMRWRGSIWKAVWKELLVYLVFYYVVRHTFGEICHMFYEYTHAIPLTFLLGFYVHNVVERWWHQFKSLKWPEDVLEPLCIVIPRSDERSHRRRYTIARYVNLAAALAWRDVSPRLRHRFPEVTDFVKSGLMTEEEYQILKADCRNIRWMTPLHWAQQIMEDEDKDNKPNELAALRESLREVYCFDWVCVPLVYTQVTALATYAYFFFTLFGDQFIIGKNVDLIIPIVTIVKFIFFIGWFKTTMILNYLTSWIEILQPPLALCLVWQTRDTVRFWATFWTPILAEFEKNTDKLWDSKPKTQLEPTGTRSSKYHKNNSPLLHAFIDIDDDKKRPFVKTCTTLRTVEKRKLLW